MHRWFTLSSKLQVARIILGSLAFYSLVFNILGCQTFAPKKDRKESEVLEKQKDIVVSHLDSGSPDKALHILRKLNKMHPQDSSIKTLLGFTHLALQNPGTGVKFLEDAHHMDKSVRSGLNLTAGYIEARSLLLAKNLLISITKHKNFPNYRYRERVYHNLGVVLERKKDHRKAKRAYRQALRENPTFYLSHINLAKLFNQESNEKKAYFHFGQAKKYCKKCYEPVAGLVKLNVTSGNVKAARTKIQAFLKIDGIHPQDVKLAREQQQRLATMLSEPKK